MSGTTKVTHFNKVSGVNGLYAGAKGSENLLCSGIAIDTLTHDFGSIADGGAESVTLSGANLTGVALGDFALASLAVDLEGLTLTAAVKEAGKVTVTAANNTGGAVDLAETTVAVKVLKQ